LVPSARAETPQMQASVKNQLVRSSTDLSGSPRLPGVSDMKSMAYWARPRAWLVSRGRVTNWLVAGGMGAPKSAVELAALESIARGAECTN
jgi:hypothetical protein